MPVLVGFCVAIRPDAASAGRAADREASLFLEALRGNAPDPVAHAAAVERFVTWAAAWLARERVTEPVLYPLPAAESTHLSELAGALARRIGGAPVRPILTRAAQGTRGAPAVLAESLGLAGEAARGTPIVFGDVYDPDLLRASALKLNDAGAKPMHALYAARIDAAQTADPWDVRDESFSVR